jgi:hypothetical protein
MSRSRRWLSICTLLTVVALGACSSKYEPPSHTYSGVPRYGGIGISVWGGMVTPVVIGDPVVVGDPQPAPDVEIKVKQLPLDPLF